MALPPAERAPKKKIRKKPKKPYVLPKDFKTEAPARPREKPQRKIVRKRNAPPSVTDRTSKRSPAQKAHDQEVVDRNVREAKIKVLRRRSRPLSERLAVSSKGTLVLKGDGRPQRGLPGAAAANPVDDLGSALGPQVNRLITKRSRPEDTKAPALKALEIISRPTKAVMSAAKHDVQQVKKHGIKGVVGHGSLKATVPALKGETNDFGSDVLKEAGVKNKLVRGVGGFVLDMALDPTRTAKISRLAPKTHLERAARQEESSAAKAAKPGRVRPAQPKKVAKHKARAQKLRRKAETASDSPGVQVGFEGRHHRVMTSGKASSKAGKKVRPAAERVGDSAFGQAVKGAVMPTARRKGETVAERDAFVYAERKRRAGANEAGRKGHRRGTAHARAVKGVAQERVIARVEDPKALASPQVKRVASATKTELGTYKALQKDAGVLEGERPDYYPHQLAPTKGILSRKGRGTKPGHSKTRKDPRPIHVQHAERAAEGKGPIFSTSHGAVMGKYTTNAERAISEGAYLKDIKAAGKPLTAGSLEKMRDTDGLYKITPTSIQPVRHPSGKDLDADAIQALIEKGEDITILPKSRGDAEVAGRVGGKSEQTRQTLKALNKPMQVFKTAATVLNVPFYQIRNFMDDSFHAYAADTPVTAFPKATGLVKDLALKERREKRRLTPGDIDGTIDVAGKDVPRVQFLREATEDGAVRTGFFAGDDLLEGSTKPATGARRVRPVQKVREWSQNAEDVPRLSTYYAARDRGMTRPEAAAHTRLYHFDYDELTDIERVIRATLVPFYTYARKNTPLMARLFFTRPGKLSAIEKLRQEFNKYGQDENYKARVDKLRPQLDAAVKAGIISKTEVQNLYNGQFDSLLTDPDQRGFPFLGPDGSIQYMPLGVTDLNRVPFAMSWDAVRQLPGRQFDLAMQMIGPQKLPLEIGQNYSFFFRDAIFRSEREPSAERWVTAPPWAKKAGIPTSKQKVDGKIVDAWPAKLDYTIRSLGPQAGMLATVGNPAKTGRGATWEDMLLKQVTGVRRARFDDRLLAGIISRAAKRKARIGVILADKGDVPDSRGKTEDSYFYSKEYEALLDEQKTLQGLIDNLRVARTGARPEKPVRLSRRPKPYDQQIKDRIDARLEKYGNYDEYLTRKYGRDAAKQRIMDAGG